jgi:tetratricopeptide (TPR) repeat protein
VPLPDPKRLLETALKHNPTHLPSVQKLAEIHLANRDFSKAHEILSRAIDTGAESQTLFYLMAKLFYSQEKWNDALVQIQKSLKFNSDTDSSLQLAVSICGKLNEHDKAIKYLELLLSQYSASAKNYYKLSEFFTSEELHPKRVFLLEEAIKLEPKNELCLVRLLELYTESFKFPFLRLQNMTEIRQKGINLVKTIEKIGLNQNKTKTCIKFLFEIKDYEKAIQFYRDIRNRKLQHSISRESILYVACCFNRSGQYEHSLNLITSDINRKKDAHIEIYYAIDLATARIPCQYGYNKITQLASYIIKKHKINIDNSIKKNNFLLAKKYMYDLKMINSVINEYEDNY